MSAGHDVGARRAKRRGPGDIDLRRVGLHIYEGRRATSVPGGRVGDGVALTIRAHVPRQSDGPKLTAAKVRSITSQFDVLNKTAALYRTRITCPVSSHANICHTRVGESSIHCFSLGVIYSTFMI
jgi:hypothetical protein